MCVYMYSAFYLTFCNDYSTSLFDFHSLPFNIPGFKQEKYAMLNINTHTKKGGRVGSGEDIAIILEIQI